MKSGPEKLKYTPKQEVDVLINGHEKPKMETEYHFAEIGKIEQPMIHLVEQLKESIDAGKYDVLLGDDASGRIPTLIFRKIFLERLHKLHPNFTPEEEREALKTFFIAGGYATNNKALEKFFNEKLKNSVTRKVLFITEYISTGKSVDRILGLLEKSGIPSDVAAVRSSPFIYTEEAINEKMRQLDAMYEEGGLKPLSIADKKRISAEEYALPEWLHNAEYFQGEYKFSGFSPLDDRSDLSGVRRKYNSAHSHNSNKAHAIPSGSEPSTLTSAREDVDLMANKILEKVWGNKKG